MGRRYWKANAEVSAAIIEILNKREKVLNDALAMSKRLGGDQKHIYTANTTLGTYMCSGFIFKDGPPSKKWVKLKGTDNGWKPRARTPEHAEMSKLQTHTQPAIYKVLKASQMGKKDLVIYSAGVWVIRDVVYLALQEEAEPYGCTRISDVEFEAVTAEQSSSKRKARKATANG